jgi:hypothetical protein
MIHIPGHTNIADVLSRLCSHKSEPFDEESEHFLCPLQEVLPAITIEVLREKTVDDEELQKVIKALKTNMWPLEIAAFKAFDRELGLMNGIVVREDRCAAELA